MTWSSNDYIYNHLLLPPHLSCSALLSSFSSLIYTLLLLDTPSSKLFRLFPLSHSPPHISARYRLCSTLTDRLLTNPLSTFFHRKELSQHVVRKLPLPRRRHRLCYRPAFSPAPPATELPPILCLRLTQAKMGWMFMVQGDGRERNAGPPKERRSPAAQLVEYNNNS